jgi:F-type H+-transporting ATPase subunit epsilon
MADDKYFDLKIISPDRIFYEGKASMVELNTSEGEIGVYKNHIPLTAILEPGIVTITEAEGKKEAAVHSGFMEIQKDHVTILAEIAEWPGEIDEKRAQKAEERARIRLQEQKPGTDMHRAEVALHRSLIRQELVNKRR